jgi:DNA-binding Lrp family transcriptional regulator
LKQDEIGRLTAKTKEQQLLRILEVEFKQPPRVAQAILQDVQECLTGSGDQVKPGQMRFILTAIEARHGEAMARTKQREVLWTVDAGREDYEVQMKHGMAAVRRLRIQRLLSEAVAQNAAASQEDLARALQVSTRTIKRDCAQLAAQGVYLPTRGNLKGIGRGQTHKALIVKRWLRGETYDQIARAAHHSVSSVQRYVQTFTRVIQLHQQGMTVDEIALLLQIGWPLTSDYLAIYQEEDTSFIRERLAAQLTRLQQRGQGEKKRAA